MPYDPGFPDPGPRDLGEPCRAEHGSFLPPRKRLLAGLKQNGWLSCSSSYAAAWQSSGGSCGGLLDEVNLEVDLEGPKMGEEPPKCELGSVCFSESGDGTIAQVASNGDEVMDFGKSENAGKRRSSSPAASSHASVERMSQMTSESQHRRKFRKKGKASKPSRSDSASAPPRPKDDTFSHHERAAAAKLTAAMAAKTAAEARAIAAHKAAAAAKAAAVAKAALEAVAIAARNEDSKPPRDSIRRHPKPQISSEKQNSKEIALKQEFQSMSQIPPPVDDEELARELHRAINSSPRISRSRSRRKEEGPALSTVDRKIQGNYQRGRRRSCSLKDVEKQEVKTSRHIFESALSGCVGEDVKSKSMMRISHTMPAISLLQKAESDGGDLASVSSDCTGLSDKFFTHEEVEIMHSCDTTEKRTRKKYIRESHTSPTPCDGGSIIESNPVSKNESVYSSNEIGFNLNSDDWAAVNPDMVDVERSVNQSVSMVRDGEVGGIRNGSHPKSSESSLVTCGNEIQVVCNERDSEDGKRKSAVGTKEQLIMSQNATEKTKLNGSVQCGNPLYPDRPAVIDFRAHDLQNSGVALKGKNEASGLSVESVCQPKKSTQKDVKESLTVQDDLNRTVPDSKSKGTLSNKLQPKLVRGEGQTRNQGILKRLPKGLSTGKQTFGDSLSITTFRSTPPVSVRTPAFASGMSGRHP